MRCGGQWNQMPPQYGQNGNQGHDGSRCHGKSGVDTNEIDDIQDSENAEVSPTSGDEEARLLAEINRVRQEHGLKPLKALPQLNQAAMENNDFNISTGQLGHHVDLGKYGADGEITAWASNGITPEQAVQMWLNSPGHRAILLDPNQEYVGVDIEDGYATADFI